MTPQSSASTGRYQQATALAFSERLARQEYLFFALCALGIVEGGSFLFYAGAYTAVRKNLTHADVKPGLVDLNDSVTLGEGVMTAGLVIGCSMIALTIFMAARAISNANVAVPVINGSNEAPYEFLNGTDEVDTASALESRIPVRDDTETTAEAKDPDIFEPNGAAGITAATYSNPFHVVPGLRNRRLEATLFTRDDVPGAGNNSSRSSSPSLASVGTLLGGDGAAATSNELKFAEALLRMADYSTYAPIDSERESASLLVRQLFNDKLDLESVVSIIRGKKDGAQEDLQLLGALHASINVPTTAVGSLEQSKRQEMKVSLLCSAASDSGSAQSDAFSGLVQSFQQELEKNQAPLILSLKDR